MVLERYCRCTQLPFTEHPEMSLFPTQTPTTVHHLDVFLDHFNLSFSHGPLQKRDWSKKDISTKHTDTMDDCPSVFRFWKWVRPQITQPPDASLEQYQCICETLQEFQNYPGSNYKILSKFWDLVIILKCCKDWDFWFGMAWFSSVWVTFNSKLQVSQGSTALLLADCPAQRHKEPVFQKWDEE